MRKRVRQLHKKHPVRSNSFWAFVLLLATLAIALRALDTGSLGQWGLVFVLLGLSVNRLWAGVQALHGKL